MFSWVFREADTKRRFKRHVEENTMKANREGRAWKARRAARRGCKFDPEGNGQKSWAEASYGAMKPEDRSEAARKSSLQSYQESRPHACLLQYVCLIPTTTSRWWQPPEQCGLRTNVGEDTRALATGPQPMSCLNSFWPSQ